MNRRTDPFDDFYRHPHHRADTTPSQFHEDQIRPLPTTSTAVPWHEMTSESSLYEHDDLPFAVTTTTTTTTTAVSHE
jgi:hypothetical protein